VAELDRAVASYPTREALTKALQQVLDRTYPVSHGSGHGASESIYLSDPDGNGLELDWDRPQDEWPRTPDGKLALVNLPLELEALLGELSRR
jgi:catechol 2,3-dioxygenase